jgi:hypothetical protein
MAIKLGSAPSEGMTVVQQGLATLNRVSARRALLGGALVNVSVLQPQEVYNLSLDALAQGADLSGAKPAGWRYFISDGQEPIEAASLSPRAGGAGLEFVGVNQGELIKDASQAMIAAEKLDVVQQKDYEVRWLQIPALYVQGVWLKDLEGAEDRVLPFHIRPPLQNNQPYSAKDFLGILRDVAKIRLHYSDEPRVPAPKPGISVSQRGKKLYVGNLSYGVTDSDLSTMFEAHGTVQSAQVIMDRDTGRSKGFGFVEMKTDQEAEAAIAALTAKRSADAP